MTSPNVRPPGTASHTFLGYTTCLLWSSGQSARQRSRGRIASSALPTAYDRSNEDSNPPRNSSPRETSDRPRRVRSATGFTIAIGVFSIVLSQIAVEARAARRPDERLVNATATVVLQSPPSPTLGAFGSRVLTRRPLRSLEPSLIVSYSSRGRIISQPSREFARLPVFRFTQGTASRHARSSWTRRLRFEYRL